MIKVTVNDVIGDIEPLKKYREYLGYKTIWGKPMMDQTPAELHAFSAPWDAGIIAESLEWVANIAEKQEMFFPVYSETECQEDADKKDVGVWYLPAEGVPKKPFVILCAGGAYVCVCTVGEAFTTGKHFCEAGYNVFCLNYRVGGNDVLPKPLEDLAAAYRYIVANKERFNLLSEDYVVGGYSAGANLVSLWGTKKLGYEYYGVRRPVAMLPIYPPIIHFWEETDTKTEERSEGEAAVDYYDLPGSMDDDYPPCYIVHCEDDDCVPVKNAYVYKELLDKRNIAARLDIGAHGGHGFGDGTATDVAGWPERAIKFIQEL